LPLLRNIKAEKKVLVLGNHDILTTQEYLSVFDEVQGLVKKYGMWISHAPVHPNELRGKYNVHGHVHYASIEDDRYFNVCPEVLWPKYGRCLVSLQEMNEEFSRRFPDECAAIPQ
jgi:calcineurin-like phosphoesterase family protein